MGTKGGEDVGEFRPEPCERCARCLYTPTSPLPLFYGSGLVLAQTDAGYSGKPQAAKSGRRARMNPDPYYFPTNSPTVPSRSSVIRPRV